MPEWAEKRSLSPERRTFPMRNEPFPKVFASRSLSRSRSPGSARHCRWGMVHSLPFKRGEERGMLPRGPIADRSRSARGILKREWKARDGERGREGGERLFEN